RIRLHRARAIGSAGERLVHTEEVTGSIPVSPTRSGAVRDARAAFFDLCAATGSWKWTWPRRWNSATLAYDTLTRVSDGLPILSRWRRGAMTVRRHSSGAWAFQTTAAAKS